MSERDQQQIREQSPLLRYVNMVWKHWLVVVCMVVLCASLAVLVSFKMEPVYQATATVEVVRRPPVGLPESWDVNRPESQLWTEYIDTEKATITNLPVAQYTVLLLGGEDREYVVRERIEEWRKSLGGSSAGSSASNPELDQLNEEIKAFKNKEFDKKPRTLLKSAGDNNADASGNPAELAKMMFDQAFTEGSRAWRLAQLCANLIRRDLTVEQVGDSRHLKISMEGTNAQRVTNVANGVAKAYVLQRSLCRQDTGKEMIEFLTAQSRDAEKKLEKAELKVEDYRKEKGILKAADTGYKALWDELHSRVRNMNAEYSEAKLQVEQIREHLSAGKPPEDLPMLLASNRINALKTERLKLVQLINDRRLQGYKDSDLKVRTLKDRLNQVNESISKEARVLIEATQAFYKEKEQEKNRLEAELAAKRDYYQRKENDLATLAKRERKRDDARQLYETLVNRIAQIEVVQKGQQENAKIMELAQRPSVPIKPRKLFSTLLGALVGLFLGLAAAISWESVWGTMEEPDDFDGMGVRLLGTVPRMSRRFKDLHARISDRGAAQQEVKDRFPQEKYRRMVRATEESFRNIRTQLLFQTTNNDRRVFLVTSARPNEGKTVLTSNIAILLAQMFHHKVLVIDADLRKPGIKKAFDIQRSEQNKDLKGLWGLARSLISVRREPLTVTAGETVSPSTSAVADYAGTAGSPASGSGSSWRDFVVSSSVEGVFVLPAGDPPGSEERSAPAGGASRDVPSRYGEAEILNSPGFREIVEQAGDEYDAVLLDSPPVEFLSDANLLAELSDGVMLVVSQGTHAKAVRDAVKKLNSHGDNNAAKLLGVVFNRFRPRIGSYYRYYYYPYYAYQSCGGTLRPRRVRHWLRSKFSWLPFGKNRED